MFRRSSLLQKAHDVHEEWDPERSWAVPSHDHLHQSSWQTLSPSLSDWQAMVLHHGHHSSWVAATSQRSRLQNIFPVAVFDASMVHHWCSSNRLPSGKGSFLIQDKYFPPPWERERGKLKCGFLIPFQQGEQNGTKAAVDLSLRAGRWVFKGVFPNAKCWTTHRGKAANRGRAICFEGEKNVTRKILKGTFYISMTIIINTCLWSSVLITRKEVINMKTNVKSFANTASGRSSNRK